MKEKINYFLFLLLITLVSTANGQNGFLSSNHSYEIDSNNFKLFSETYFSIGYGSTCPRLDTFIVSTSNRIISINLFYDLRGNWPQAGCCSYDTTIAFIDTYFSLILVNTNTITYGSSINDSIINIVQTDTLVENPLGNIESSLNNAIKIFPNPTNTVLNIEFLNYTIIEKIELFDVIGKKAKTFNKSDKELDVSEFVPCIYYLKILTKDGEITKKVLIE
ncbi:MAG: T9SS type A sorting domain-containing protein [Salinivirgaceae bacterium]|nr:T9SS type A sorting domain-containing protein [Salinivirgaceae bacterium]